MIDAAVVVLQNLTEPEKKRVLCSEMSPASSQDAYQAEVLSEDPLAITFPGIKAEPEVSSVHVRLISEI
jgi:hypothetical protein